MRVCKTVDEMRQVCRELRNGGTLGFVPTMGALHAGHLSLVRAAQVDCSAVVASIFVNPKQFAASEDFAIYPRVFEEDCRKLKAAGVQAVFAPSVQEMYPAGAGETKTFIEVAAIGERLDGASRPGHFRGVATVVAKLFNIVGPDRAYFGQKDAAQVAVLQAMVRDLNFAVQLVACPTVREEDGLAMSSRNSRLSAEEHEHALVLRRALRAAETMLHTGETSSQTLRATMLKTLAKVPAAQVDYAEIVNPMTLEPVEDTTDGALLAVAAQVGATRLIDNLVIERGPHA